MSRETNEIKNEDLIEEFTEVELDGVDELNIAEFPLAVLSQRPKGNKVTYSNLVTDPVTRKKIKRELVISADQKDTSLPTVLDANVILALLQFHERIDERNFQSFHLREICRILGLNEDGRTVSRVKQSLITYYNLDLSYSNAWFDAYSKEWRHAKFRIINAIEYTDSGEMKIQWGEHFLKNIKSGYLKPLDLELFRNLKNPIAQTLFRFLDKKFYTRHALDYEVENLAFNHLGFPKSSTPDISTIKKRLKVPITILEDFNFIERDPKRFYKKRKIWRIRFNRIDSQSQEQADLFSNTEEDILQERMRDQGIMEQQSSNYLKKYGYQRVLETFEVVLFRKISNISKIKDFPVYFSKVVQDDNLTKPKGFTTEQERIKVEKDRIATKTATQAEQDKINAKAEQELAEAMLRVNKVFEVWGKDKADRFIRKNKLNTSYQGGAMWYYEVEELLNKQGAFK